MPILVKCDCGAKYRVKDELAGRVMRCKRCDESIAIEAANDEIMDAIEVPQPSPPRRRPKPKRSSDDDQMLEELEQAQRDSQSAASNPGMMKVSYWRHFLAYPKWAVIWHLSLLVSIGLVFMSWFCIPLVLFFLWAIWMYWNRVKTQFVAGCVNPGIVLSLDPPLVAVHTNLTQGGPDEWNVVKVMAAPIHRMITGRPVDGDRIVTVSFYEARSDEVDHWTDFQPKLAACVTSNPDDPRRLLNSIEKEDWKEFKDDLRQVPKPYEPGLYRTYARESLSRKFTLDPDDIVDLIESELAGIKYCMLMSEGEMVPHETKCYVPPKAKQDVVAVIESSSASADVSQGLSLTHVGLFYNFKDVGKGVFRWEKVVGAFVTNRGLEITLTDGKRLEFPSSNFLTEMIYRLETLITTIGRG